QLSKASIFTNQVSEKLIYAKIEDAPPDDSKILSFGVDRFLQPSIDPQTASHNLVQQLEETYALQQRKY
ncbi:hypothetical protein ACTXT7_017260, partial [Hymenolepis weldensis]